MSADIALWASWLVNLTLLIALANSYLFCYNNSAEDLKSGTNWGINNKTLHFITKISNSPEFHMWNNIWIVKMCNSFMLSFAKMSSFAYVCWNWCIEGVAEGHLCSHLLVMWHQACQAILRNLFLTWTGGTQNLHMHLCTHLYTYACKYLGVRVTLPIEESRNTSSPPLSSSSSSPLYILLLSLTLCCTHSGCSCIPQRLYAVWPHTLGQTHNSGRLCFSSHLWQEVVDSEEAS